MKVLLVGEYSRLHNSLKEGLQALGHEVVLIASGDGFKDYPADIKLKRRFSTGLGQKLKVLLYHLFGFDLSSYLLFKAFKSRLNDLRAYDVVQLINESPLGIQPRYEKKIIGFLKENNKRLFLLSCGTDYLTVKFAADGKLRYSMFDPFRAGKISEKDFDPVLQYLRPDFKALHDFVYAKVDGVIASDLDYHLALTSGQAYLGLAPNPVNVEKLQFQPVKKGGKLVIFHGINRGNYFKKGNDFFDEALKVIEEKYPDEVEVLSVENLPYSEYIKCFDRAQVLLDQVYSYDQGYNALEAMAKGKVVFTGAELEFEEHYKLKEKVAINALPNVEYLVAELEKLVLDRDSVIRISQNARKFIDEHHDYKQSAQKYIDYWTT